MSRVILIDGSKHDGPVGVIPMLQTTEKMILASIVRSDNIESIVVKRNKEEVIRSWLSNNLVVIKYAKWYEEVE